MAIKRIEESMVFRALFQKAWVTHITFNRNQASRSTPSLSELQNKRSTM